MKTKRVVAAFDFDGTIIRGDSFFELIKLSHPPFQRCIVLLKATPFLLRYLLKLISNSEAKERLFKLLYEGISMDEAIFWGEIFQKNMLPEMIKMEAQAKLQWHQKNGHEVVIVTATFIFLLDKWCEEHGYELLCTEPETKNGKLTGFFANNNCYGEEKIKRLKAWWGKNPPDILYAYGDSKGDRPMLSLANFSFYRKFN